VTVLDETYYKLDCEKRFACFCATRKGSLYKPGTARQIVTEALARITSFDTPLYMLHFCTWPCTIVRRCEVTKEFSKVGIRLSRGNCYGERKSIAIIPWHAGIVSVTKRCESQSSGLATLSGSPFPFPLSATKCDRSWGSREVRTIQTENPFIDLTKAIIVPRSAPRRFVTQARSLFDFLCRMLNSDRILTHYAHSIPDGPLFTVLPHIRCTVRWRRFQMEGIVFNESAGERIKRSYVSWMGELRKERCLLLTPSCYSSSRP
jgi:hypothetical protein